MNIFSDVNCTQVFSLSIDSLGRQIFLSCINNHFDKVGAIHVWKIKVRL